MRSAGGSSRPFSDKDVCGVAAENIKGSRARDEETSEVVAKKNPFETFYDTYDANAKRLLSSADNRVNY